MKEEFDAIVVGSGAGGLSAAISARFGGLNVVVLEKDALIGGTTALSGGVLWVPANPVARRLGIHDDPATAETYLRHEAKSAFNAEVVHSFLENGPEMVRFFEENTAVRFEAAAKFPDYHSDAPGASQGGRSLRVNPYDARELGPHLALLRSPLPEMSIFGTMTISGNEVNDFYNATRSLKSFWHVSRLVARHFLDTALHSRSTRLTNGNALAARLARTAIDAGVVIRTRSTLQAVLIEQGRVVGVRVTTPEGERELRARKGVVLACGGFPHDIARRSSLFPHDPTGQEHVSPAPLANTGDGIRIGMLAGGQLKDNLPQAAAWVPVSRVPKPDGTLGVFPHFFDRSKPGVIAVTRDGVRFANESGSYHDMVQGMIAACGTRKKSAFLVCDHKAIRRYGLGFVKPWPFPIRPHLRSGYLKQGRSIAELARAAGIDATRLTQTVARFNAEAAKGIDPDFHRGATSYNRAMGDPLGGGPNPCLAPLDTGPFYAVEIHVGDLGTFAGLAVNGDAQVLDQSGAPIPGLFAAGNDMCSIMGGNYPAAGITLGPAMTFGYIAGRRLAL